MLLHVAAPPSVAGHMARGGSLTEYEGGGPILTGPNFLTLPCDVLIPAALGGVINAKVAERLQCKVRRALLLGCGCCCWLLQNAARGVRCNPAWKGLMLSVAAEWSARCLAAVLCVPLGVYVVSHGAYQTRIACSSVCRVVSVCSGRLQGVVWPGCLVTCVGLCSAKEAGSAVLRAALLSRVRSCLGP